jgi:hypothetical protein
VTMSAARFGLVLLDAKCGKHADICCFVTGVNLDDREAVVATLKAKLAMLNELDDDQLLLLVLTACASCDGKPKNGTTSGGGTSPGQQNPSGGNGNGGGTTSPQTPSTGSGSQAILDCYKKVDEWLCGHQYVLGMLDSLATVISQTGVGQTVAADISAVRLACTNGTFKGGDTASARTALASLCRVRMAVQAGGILGSFAIAPLLLGALATATFWDCCTLGGVGPDLSGNPPQGGGSPPVQVPGPQGQPLPTPGLPTGGGGGGFPSLPGGQTPTPTLPGGGNYPQLPSGGGAGGGVSPFVPQSPAQRPADWGDAGEAIGSYGGAALGAAACSELGPVGMAACGYAGEWLGGMAGEAIGDALGDLFG